MEIDVPLKIPTKNYSSLSYYFGKLTKNRISLNAAETLDIVATEIAIRLSWESNMLSEADDRVTILPRDVQYAAKITFDDAGLDHFIESRIKMFDDAETVTGKRKRLATKAGLILPPVRFRKIMSRKTCREISESSVVAVTAAVEYIIKIVLKDASDYAKEKKKSSITLGGISYSIAATKPLHWIFKKMILPGTLQV